MKCCTALLLAALPLVIAAGPIKPSPKTDDGSIRRCADFVGDQGSDGLIVFPNEINLWTDGQDDGTRGAIDMDSNELTIISGQQSLADSVVSVQYYTDFATPPRYMRFSIKKNDYCTAKLPSLAPGETMKIISIGSVRSYTHYVAKPNRIHK